MLDRRRFLAATGLSAAAGLARAAQGPGAPVAETPSWDWVRDQFELARDYVHLASFYFVSHPRPVREAIEQLRRALDHNPVLLVERGLFQQPVEVQAAAAEYVGGLPEEVALTGNTTTGLALVYNGLPLRGGQEVLTTSHDHYSHHESIRLAARRAGASVRKVALYDDPARASEDEIVDRIRRALRPQTRVVGVTWVHSCTGVKLPLRGIARVLGEANRGRDEADRALLVVDGVHGFGVEDETVAATGCDVFVAGTHKWIFGPRGTGIVWARAGVWAKMQPTIPAFHPGPYTAWLEGREPREGLTGGWVSPGGFHAYEHQWALPAAFRFHQRIGRARIARRIHHLNDLCKEGLARMPHVKLYTPRGSGLAAGIVCFDVTGLRPEAVVQRLLERGIVASTTPYAPSYARLAPSLVNTPEEIETTLRALDDLGNSGG